MKATQNNKSFFTTQADILKRLGNENSKGICSQLANLYANYKMGVGNRRFLDAGQQETCNEVRQMTQHQSDVKNEFQGELGALLGMNVAFYDNDILFKADLQPVDKISTDAGFRESLADSDHALINYPMTTKKNPQVKPYHQVYFGKKNDKCSYFNANILGGEREGSCREMTSLAISDLIQNAAHDGRPCVVARSINKP